MQELNEEGFIGYQPGVKVTPGNPEAEKYGRMWEHDEYRTIAPGEIFSRMFLDRARPRAGASVIDFGCGTGRGGLALALLGQLDVTLIDFVRNSLDRKVRDAVGGSA